MEDVILPELLSDNLYDVPEDSLVISGSDRDKSVRERKIVCPKQSYSESQTSLEESDDSNDTSNVWATTWVKEDKVPNLGPFTRNPGVKQIPSKPTKVSEIIELFFRDSFFEMLSKETKRCYFQNQGKYNGSSKVLKWVDVSVVCAAHKKSETRYIC
jgi:hypothetical protein